MKTVKDAKKKLNELLNILNNYDENNEFYIETSDDCGGCYETELNDLKIECSTVNGAVVLTNF